jgi:hypothetical protein
MFGARNLDVVAPLGEARPETHVHLLWWLARRSPTVWRTAEQGRSRASMAGEQHEAVEAEKQSGPKMGSGGLLKPRDGSG